MINLVTFIYLTSTLSVLISLCFSASMPLATRDHIMRMENISSEQKLMMSLMWKYENSVRPIYNSSKPVEVVLGLTLTQILDLVGCHHHYPFPT